MAAQDGALCSAEVGQAVLPTCRHADRQLDVLRQRGCSQPRVWKKREVGGSQQVGSEALDDPNASLVGRQDHFPAGGAVGQPMGTSVPAVLRLEEPRFDCWMAVAASCKSCTSACESKLSGTNASVAMPGGTPTTTTIASSTTIIARRCRAAVSLRRLGPGMAALVVWENGDRAITHAGGARAAVGDVHAGTYITRQVRSLPTYPTLTASACIISNACLPLPRSVKTNGGVSTTTPPPS